MSDITIDLDSIIQQYSNNSYILNRLQLYLNNIPTVLEQDLKKYNERQSRMSELHTEQDKFCQLFLNKHRYYYMPYNNIYYDYDGIHYRVVKEDDIHYHLLSTITDEGKLIQWKHKTKFILIKKIKDRCLFKSIPESKTIQNILFFLTGLFKTKQESKYFLTVLGDCILKKNTDNFQYFITPFMKKIISIIDSITYITTGTSINGNFIVKYHDSHQLGSYRIITTMDTACIDNIKEQLNIVGITGGSVPRIQRIIPKMLFQKRDHLAAFFQIDLFVIHVYTSVLIRLSDSPKALSLSMD